MYRVVRQRFTNPWWFNSDGSGRFDLDPPEGTCYLAFDSITAILEVLGPRLGGPISRQFLTHRRLHVVSLPKPVRAASTIDRAGVGYGLTAEIATHVPYDLTRRWAAGWREAGFDGIVFRARHDPKGERNLALFGRSGPRTAWEPGTRQTIGDELIARLEAECGLEVLDVPRLDQLDLV